MTRQTVIMVALILGLFTGLHAQKSKDSSPKPSNMLEVGVHGGYFFVAGDVKHKTGYAGGIHIRKATDYMFSLRADLLAGKLEGENDADNVARSFSSTWYSGTILGIFSLNSFKFDQDVRKLNYYAGVGVGANSYMTEFSNEEMRIGTIERDIMPHATLAAGIAFRLSKRVNLGIEHQASLGFGKRADQIDGSELENGIRTPFRDIVNYTSLRVNINIGSTARNTEPLWWINPLGNTLSDVSDIKKKQDEIVQGLQDNDRDGVIDAIDQDPNTPPDVPVDTKGRTLDSDRDGIADYLDKEPYYPPRPGEQVDDQGVVINPQAGGGRGGVTEQRVKELIDEALQGFQPANGASGSGGGTGGAAVAEWFLPMIHFGTDSYTIKYSDYGTLASIAKMMKSNSQLRLVVTGFTDATAPENYNNQLSYARAKAVVDHLNKNHNIGRGRLIIQWKGEENALVPSSSSYMNRRVEFSIAKPGDVEMDPPSGSSDKKKSGY